MDETDDQAVKPLLNEDVQKLPDTLPTITRHISESSMDPDERRRFRLEKRKKQINWLGRIVLMMGSIFTLIVIIYLSIVVQEIQDFPWNRSLGFVIYGAYFQLLYFGLGWAYQKWRKNWLYICYVVISILNIAALVYVAFWDLSDVISNYQGTLPEQYQLAYNKLGAAGFGGTLLYILYVSIVTVVLSRDYEIMNMRPEDLLNYKAPKVVQKDDNESYSPERN